MNPSRKAVNPRVLTALLFAGILLLGWLTAADYGVYCDQLSEQVILRENMKEYAVRLLGEDSQAVAYYDALNVQRISKSLEIDHGECAYYPLVPLMFLRESNPPLFSIIWHGYTWLLFALGVLALYGTLRELEMKRGIALLGACLLFVNPRFFAEGHYNNKDVVLLVLVIGSFYTGLRFLKKPNAVRGMLFSLVGAMAANTKIVGISVWGLLGVSAIVMLTARRQWNKRMVGVASFTILVFAAAFALLTPAMWSNPVHYFQYLLQNATSFARWTGVVLFRGTIYDYAVNPLPRSYLPYMMLVTLPLYFFPLCAIGEVSVLKRIAKSGRKSLGDPNSLVLLSATILCVLFVGYVVLAHPLVYNGWRHFYFLFAGLVLLAAQGIECLWRIVQKWRKCGKAVFSVVCCGCLLATAVPMMINHPYQYAYYNVLVPRNAEENMELDYWEVSTLNAVKKLGVVERDETLPLKMAALDDMSRLGLAFMNEATAQQDVVLLKSAENAPYLFVNTTYGEIYNVQIPAGYHELFSLQSYGNRICTVYEMNRE